MVETEFTFLRQLKKLLKKVQRFEAVWHVGSDTVGLPNRLGRFSLNCV
jgi:hypothetical protein